MIIIVEGIDRVGKTTLCNKLSKELNIPIHKYDGIIKYNEMDNDNETDKMLSLIQLINETKTNIIFDRFYFSDFVYGCLERWYNLANAVENFEIVDRTLNEIEQVYLLLINPTNISKSNLEHGSTLNEHNDLMNFLFNKSIVKNKFVLDYNDIDNVVKYFKRRKNEK